MTTTTALSEVELLEKIRSNILDKPDCLDMSAWHGHCGTTHCIAGWAKYLAGDMTKDAQEEGTRLIPSAKHMFFVSNRMAKCWLETRRWIEENRQTFHDAMRAVGILVATAGGTITTVAQGGEGWADSGGTITTVAQGGVGWADSGGTITTVAQGGVGWAYSGGTITTVAQGGVGWAYSGGTITTVAQGGVGWAYSGGTITTVAQGGVGWAYSGGTIEGVTVHASEWLQWDCDIRQFIFVVNAEHPAV